MNQQDLSAVKLQHDVSDMMMIKTVMPRNVSYYFFFEPDYIKGFAHSPAPSTTPANSKPYFVK